MEMFGVANTDSLHEFWDAALKRLKAYVEAEGRDSTFIIDDRRRTKYSRSPIPNPAYRKTVTRLHTCGRSEKEKMSGFAFSSWRWAIPFSESSRLRND
jgi:hypothetical protein